MFTEMLLSLTVEDIEQGTFHLQDILSNSLFYPASGTDGTPIRHWIPSIQSFVYVDTSITKKSYEQIIHNEPPKGYSVLANRQLQPDDLAPNGWVVDLPKSINVKTYISRMRLVDASPATSFAMWTVFERNSHLKDDHGPIRFSLVFIRAEGVAAYQALYIGNQICPLAVAVVRPGTGFGGNYSNFEEVLLEVVQSNSAGMPQWLMQWHHSDRTKTHPESPWDKHYRERVNGPFQKDNDPGFSISVYGKNTT